jgi:hypothetical protein
VCFSWRREWWAIHTLIVRSSKMALPGNPLTVIIFSFSFYSDGMIHEDWTFMLILHIWNVDILIQKGFLDFKTLCKKSLVIKHFKCCIFPSSFCVNSREVKKYHFHPFHTKTNNLLTYSFSWFHQRLGFRPTS